jgi:hypothetical protein
VWDRVQGGCAEKKVRRPKKNKHFYQHSLDWVLAALLATKKLVFTRHPCPYPPETHPRTLCSIKQGGVGGATVEQKEGEVWVQDTFVCPEKRWALYTLALRGGRLR